MPHSQASPHMPLADILSLPQFFRSHSHWFACQPLQRLVEVARAQSHGVSRPPPPPRAGRLRLPLRHAAADAAASRR